MLKFSGDEFVALNYRSLFEIQWGWLTIRDLIDM